MFGSIGGFELLVLAAIGLLVFGPKRLPEIGRTLAKGLNELRKAAGDMRASLEKEADLGPVKQVAGDLKDTIQREAGRFLRGLDEETRAVAGAVNDREEPKREPGGPAPAP